MLNIDSALQPVCFVLFGPYRNKNGTFHLLFQKRVTKFVYITLWFEEYLSLMCSHCFQVCHTDFRLWGTSYVAWDAWWFSGAPQKWKKGVLEKLGSGQSMQNLHTLDEEAHVFRWLLQSFPILSKDKHCNGELLQSPTVHDTKHHCHHFALVCSN